MPSPWCSEPRQVNRRTIHASETIGWSMLGMLLVGRQRWMQMPQPDRPDRPEPQDMRLRPKARAKGNVEAITGRIEHFAFHVRILPTARLVLQNQSGSSSSSSLHSTIHPSIVIGIVVITIFFINDSGTYGHSGSSMYNPASPVLHCCTAQVHRPRLFFNQ